MIYVICVLLYCMIVVGEYRLEKYEWGEANILLSFIMPPIILILFIICSFASDEQVKFISERF